MKKLLLTILTLLSSQAFALSNTTFTATPGVNFDTRCEDPRQKQAFPDFTGLSAGDNLGPIMLRNYVAQGDPAVTASAKCANLNPDFVASSLPTTTTLVKTDKANATLAVTTAVAGSGTGSLVVSNDATVGNDLTISIPWNVAGGANPLVVIPANSARFVSSAGNDTADGLTCGTPWRNIAKVNAAFTSSTGTSVDVYFRAGDNFGYGYDQGTAQALKIDWSGTNGDHVKVGTYFCSGGIAYEAKPTTITSVWPLDYVYTNARATLNGSCPYISRDSVGCKRNTNGIYSGDITPALPTGYTAGLIEVTGNYVDVQDIRDYGSAGYGFIVQPLTPRVTNVTFSRMYIDYSVNAAGRFYGATNATFRDSVTRHTATVGNPDDLSANPALFAASNIHSLVAGQYLIEGNDMAQSFGGGIQIFYGPKSYIVRGNRIGDIASNRPCVYGDDGDDIVIEYNICYGGGWSPSGQTVQRTRGIVLTYENLGANVNSGNPAKVPLTDLLIRGNMLTGTMGCFELGGYGSATESQTGKIYGNTCFKAVGKVFDMYNEYVTGAAGIQIYDNIFMTDLTQAQGVPGGDPIPGVDACRLSSHGATAPTFDYNMWNVAPAVTACRGAHDVTGTAVLAGSNTIMTSPNSSANVVTPASFAIQAGSPGLDAGTPLTSTLLSTSDYPQYTLISVPCASFDLKGNALDSTCTVRSLTTPDIGADER